MEIKLEKIDDGREVLFQAEIKLNSCERNFELDAGYGDTKEEALMDLSREINDQTYVKG